MDDKDLDAIRERADRATPGPWGHWGQGWIAPEHDPQHDPVGVPQNLVPRNDADAEFIAHARVDVPALLDEVERLNALVTEHVAALDDAEGQVEALTTRVDPCTALDLDAIRRRHDEDHEHDGGCDLLDLMAEVERLRAERDRLQAAVEAVRALADEFDAEAYRGSLSGNPFAIDAAQVRRRDADLIRNALDEHLGSNDV